MFERFTDRARRVVVFAQDEAKVLHHDYIGTEHILLGLIQEHEGVAAEVLDALGASLDEVRARVEAIVGEGGDARAGPLPFTARAKKVLELSLREARLLGHDFIGTEHILLGLIREGEGVAAQVLQDIGVDLSHARSEVIRVSSESHAAAGRGVPVEQKPSEVSRAESARVEHVATCAWCQAPLGHVGRISTVEVDEGGEATMARLLYCGACGRVVGPVA
jgi:ATP-dependent Clp protease ATP-binding subunit ClpC